ncbi:hypothetical protein P280DRAFT_53218 [Massarina eburnea CBS 473.64]|uniref:Uncharacterized protein n=1 Tax=Massarina eburnea CBS 473.64 TaxID=1395130 RepID=A0A6A6RVR5_9PLEO|nr:hypothetical protein P280DRAFT_53218 [Massarina eburnea CBS 473.64]
MTTKANRSTSGNFAFSDRLSAAERSAVREWVRERPGTLAHNFAFPESGRVTVPATGQAPPGDQTGTRLYVLKAVHSRPEYVGSWVTACLQYLFHGAQTRTDGGVVHLWDNGGETLCQYKEGRKLQGEIQEKRFWMTGPNLVLYQKPVSHGSL